MNRILKTGIVAVLSIIIVAGMVACSGGTVTKTVTPTDYDNTRASLADAQKTIIALQQQIQSLQNQNSDLQAQVTDQSNNAAGLQKKYDALNTQFQQLTVQETQDQATITSLRTLYQAMKAAQDMAAAEAANVTAANIETAMFAAINNIRAQAGLAVLKPGTNTRVAAVNNSQNMATHKDIVTFITLTRKSSLPRAMILWTAWLMPPSLSGKVTITGTS